MAEDDGAAGRTGVEAAGPTAVAEVEFPTASAVASATAAVKICGSCELRKGKAGFGRRPVAKGPVDGLITPGATGELKGLAYPSRPQAPGGGEAARDLAERRRERPDREGLRRRERLP